MGRSERKAPCLALGFGAGDTPAGCLLDIVLEGRGIRNRLGSSRAREAMSLNLLVAEVFDVGLRAETLSPAASK